MQRHETARVSARLALSLTVGVLLVAGCRRPVPLAPASPAQAAARAHHAAAPAAAPATPLASLAWLPADLELVAGFAPGWVPMVLYLDDLEPVRGVPCWRTLRGTVAEWYQLTHAMGQPAVNLARLTAGRDQVERCLVDVLAAVGYDVTVRRAGDVTEFTAADGARSFVRWRDGGWAAWHDDRAVLDTLFATRGARLGANRELVAMLARVDVRGTMWMASSLDFAGALLGASSVGWVVQGPLRDQDADASMRATFVYASEQDAARAHAALVALAAQPGWSAAARLALANLRPDRAGREVTVEPSALFAGTSPETMREFTEALRRAVEANGADAAP